MRGPVSVVAVVNAARREHGPLDLDLVADIVPRVARGDVHEDPPVGHVAAREWDTAVRVVRHARKIGISTIEAARAVREDTERRIK